MRKVTGSCLKGSRHRWPDRQWFPCHGVQRHTYAPQGGSLRRDFLSMAALLAIKADQRASASAEWGKAELWTLRICQPSRPRKRMFRLMYVRETRGSGSGAWRWVRTGAGFLSLWVGKGSGFNILPRPYFIDFYFLPACLQTCAWRPACFSAETSVLSKTMFEAPPVLLLGEGQTLKGSPKLSWRNHIPRSAIHT